jgi:hypothetical protein
MTAGAFYFCGAFGGELSGPTKYNKKGMFENNDIRETIVKPILKSIGADPLGQNPLPDINAFKNNSDLSNNTKNKILTVLKKQGLKEDQIWFYKGAKLCLMWPLWHAAFPNAKWILVRRDDEGIINSCLKTGFMSKYKDSAGWQKWIDIHKQRFEEMKIAGLDITETWPKDMISGNFDSIKVIIKQTGLEWNADKVLSFITPALWSNIKRNVKEGSDVNTESE